MSHVEEVLENVDCQTVAELVDALDYAMKTHDGNTMYVYLPDRSILKGYSVKRSLLTDGSTVVDIYLQSETLT